MEKLISKENFYKNINTGEKFYFKNKRGFLVVLENEAGKEIRTTEKKLKSDYKLEENKGEKEMKIEIVKLELTKDIIIEVGQKLSNGHLITFEQKEENIEFLIETEENESQVLIYSKNEVIKLAKQYGIIKVKGLKVVNKENIEMEFKTINEFYKHLLKETGKEKINKGLLYNLKNGKSKSCYGYKLVEEN